VTPTPWLSPYEQGAEAFRAGVKRAACPYNPEHLDGHLKALSWHNGWRRAEYEDASPPNT